MQACVRMGATALHHLQQGMLYLLVDVTLEHRDLRSQCQARTFVLGKDALGGGIERPRQLVLVKPTHIQRTACCNQLLRRAGQQVISPRENQPGAQENDSSGPKLPISLSKPSRRVAE